jgi:hypothetical protein
MRSRICHHSAINPTSFACSGIPPREGCRAKKIMFESRLGLRIPRLNASCNTACSLEEVWGPAPGKLGPVCA